MYEYFELLDQLDAEAYINGNVGSGTVAEMQASTNPDVRAFFDARKS